MIKFNLLKNKMMIILFAWWVVRHISLENLIDIRLAVWYFWAYAICFWFSTSYPGMHFDLSGIPFCDIWLLLGCLVSSKIRNHCFNNLLLHSFYFSFPLGSQDCQVNPYNSSSWSFRSEKVALFSQSTHFLSALSVCFQPPLVFFSV